MTHNRLHTLADTATKDPDSLQSDSDLPVASARGFSHADQDECDLFRLATHIVQYDEVLTNILVNVALRKAALSEAG